MRRLILAASVAVLALVALPLRAQDDPQQKLRALEQQVMECFRAGRYEDAAKACRAQIEIAPKMDGPHYNLACALARLGRKDEALASLACSVDLGYADADHLATDSDLESLHGEKAFDALVARAREAQAKAEEKLYEPGAEIAGVKTLEGRPEGGLRYRLRLPPDASAEKPARLVVWLHPSGGSMNKAVEALSPRLASRGFGLLVPTQKSWMAWSDSDATRLLEKTLPEVAKIPGVDARRPVLLGFSAGGQMALELWADGPGRFGGLVLDAAYPIDAAAYQQRRIEARKLPVDEAVKTVPLFVLVGAEDSGSRIWKMVEADWRKAGVPLTIEYVAGGKHEWLFRETQTAALLAWLGDVAAGKRLAAAAEQGD